MTVLDYGDGLSGVVFVTDRLFSFCGNSPASHFQRRENMIVPIPFPYRRPLTAHEYEQQGGQWKPQVHFTGSLNDPIEVRFIEHLLKKYGKGVVACFICSPRPETFSVELQFSSAKEAHECLKEYHAAFTSNGILKKKVAEQFAMNRGKLRLIAVRPAMAPEVLAINRNDVGQTITGIVGTPWELIRYPAHLNLPLTVIANDDGLDRPMAYNRCGLLGGFVVTRYSSNGSHLSLTDKHIRQVLKGLADGEDGYLNPSCNVGNALREPFKTQGIPPSGWVPSAGKWISMSGRSIRIEP
jgi:hypothetical protein